MTRTILGIDPGASGGIAVIRSGDVQVRPMPGSLTDLLVWLNIWAEGSCFAYLELVHAMPGQGVSSTFKFGQGYGHLEMALVAAGIPFERVRPAVWERKMGLLKKKGETKTQHKNRLKAKAQELFPSIKVTLKTADALLIAEYGRRLKAGEFGS